MVQLGLEQLSAKPNSVITKANKYLCTLYNLFIRYHKLTIYNLIIYYKPFKINFNKLFCESVVL